MQYSWKISETEVEFEIGILHARLGKSTDRLL